MQHWAEAITAPFGDKEKAALKGKKPLTISAKPISMSPIHQSIASTAFDTDPVDDIIAELEKTTPQSKRRMHIPPTPKKLILKEWPKDKFALIDYSDLVAPIKSLLLEAYKFMRKDIKSFDYEGYEIGENELEHCVSLKYRFTEKSLGIEHELTGRNVIDVALNVIYLLGLENGRRAERQQEQPVKALNSALSSYREANKDLRLKVAKLEAELAVLKKNPSASEEEVKQLVDVQIKESRDERIQALRAEIAKDPIKSAFAPASRSKTPFNNLVNMGKRISCPLAHWNLILEKHGWKPNDFWSIVKKKKINIKFS